MSTGGGDIGLQSVNYSDKTSKWQKCIAFCIASCIWGLNSRRIGEYIRWRLSKQKKKSFASPPEADWTGWGQQLTCYIPTYLTHLGTCTYTCRQGREPVPSWSSRRLRGPVVCLYVNRASPLPLPLPPNRVVCVSLSFLAVNLIVAHTCAASQVPNTMAEKRGFRVVIAGGGVAGLALANALEVCARPNLPQTYRQRLCI